MLGQLVNDGCKGEKEPMNHIEVDGKRADDDTEGQKNHTRHDGRLSLSVCSKPGDA